MIRNFKTWSVKTRKLFWKINGSKSRSVSAIKEEEVEFKYAKPFHQIPGPRSLPLIGNLWSFLPIIGKYNFRQLDKAAKMMYDDYGPLIRVDVTSFSKFIWICGTKDIEALLRKEPKLPERPYLKSLKIVAEKQKTELPHQGLLNTNGEEWYELRSKVQPHMMKPKTVITYLQSMDNVAREFTERIGYLKDENLEVKNFLYELNKWALESVGVVALDTHLGCLRKNVDPNDESMRLIKSALDVFDQIFALEISLLPFWRFFPTRRLKELQNNLNFFNTTALKYLQQAKERLQQESELEEKQLTLLELLLLQNTDINLIAVMIRDMFLAGIDTTSNAAGFFLYFMAKNPIEQEKLHKEIKNLLPSLESEITRDTLNNISYLKACVKESMRLLPVAVGMARVTTEDFVLSGYQIPKNTNILMQMVVGGRLESNFKNANQFIPERWLKSTSEEKHNPFSALPFGFGARSCIGRRIAEQELYTIIIRIFQKYRLEYHHEDIGISSRLLNVPDKPLRFNFFDRDL